MSKSLDLAADRKKDCFKNPIHNLIDMFLYISKYFESEHVQDGECYIQKMGTLLIEAQRHTQAENISEIIRIRKLWPDSSFETYVYSMETIEHIFWQEKEKSRMKATGEGNDAFCWQLRSKRLVKYWNKNDYIDSIIFLPPMDCELEYMTNNLGRGLKTLLGLNISEADPANPQELEENPFRFLVSGMRGAAEDVLKISFGTNQLHWKEYIQEMYCDLKGSFKKRLTDVFPPWHVGYLLIDLCQFYLKASAS